MRIWGKLIGDDPYDQIDGLRLAFHPRNFIQVNDVINQQMLDLFCSLGNFTLPLARRGQEVVGVEGVAALVANGQYNALRSNLPNTSFFQQDLASDIRRQPWEAQGFDKVLLDPARTGAAGVMLHRVKLAPKRVVYVSCNHTTLARDSQVLLAAGYRLAQVRMLDRFPHTGHLESMALFMQKQAPGVAK